MNKFMIIIVAIVVGLVYQVSAIAPVNESATGTISATAFVRAGATDVVKLTDVAWKVDAGNSSGTINLRTGKKRFAVDSATSASGTVLWFDNSGSTIAVNDYLIFDDVSAAQLYLYSVRAVATTSATVYQTITPATTVSDYVWALNTTVTRPALDASVSGTVNMGQIYLPGQAPTAISLDGNTTSCRISASGVRE